MGKKGFLLLSTFFILLILPQPFILGQESVTIEGVVREHRTGNPLPHADVLVLKGYYRQGNGYIWWIIFQGETDSDGYFSLKVSEGWDYILYAYYNDSQTPGSDYVPSMEQIQRASGDYSLTFELRDGASMILDGEALFVETAKTPRCSYSVSDTDSGEVIQYGEYSFNYGEESPHNYLPGVNSNHIIVPANTTFMVKVDSQIEVEGETLTRSFLMDKPGHFLLEKGEAIHVDIREYTLPLSLSTIREEASEIGLLLDETEEEGFYLAVEKQRFAQITSLILEAENDLNQGDYEACFSRLRYAYTEISNLRNWLKSMHREVLISVFLLIPFLASTATTTSHLLFEEKNPKILGALTFYAVFLIALYLLYPGSRLVEAYLFMGASLTSFVAVLGFAVWVPRVLKGREVRGRVPLRNMIVPVFSIAKRSLKRRRLRSTLTFITVMILVSSFIALTSLATGFGLTFRKVSNQPSPSIGVLVRAQKTQALPTTRYYSPASTYLVGPEPWDVFWYPPLDNSSIRWFEDRPEVLHVAPKMENLPQRKPLGSVRGAPIFGVISVKPSAEIEGLPWNEMIVEGRYLSDEDENGVLISAKLKEELNAKVGETLTLRTWQQFLRLKIIGIFDDDSFEELRDLDGEPLLPWKIEITSITQTEGVTIIIERLSPCSASETLVVTLRTASEIPWIFLSRLNIVCGEEEDLAEYAKKIALERDFRVWASTEEGIYLAQLSSYFEGKGLTLAVPWTIVVLNVVVTMLNSLYERRREIYIYSAVGMNPSHIAGAFLAEAAMIGVLGGGIGYLLGLGWYKAMSLLVLGIQVKQKVSALWVLAAIAVSLAAVLVGGYTAIKGSVSITPSLKMRWSGGKKFRALREPMELALPLRVPEAEVEDFLQYVKKKLRSRMGYLDYVTSGIRVSSEELGYCPMCGYRGPILGRCPRCDYPDIVKEASLRAIEFFYRSASPMSPPTQNKVILSKEEGGEVYNVKLLTKGDSWGVKKTASLIRKAIMEWSIERVKREGRRDKSLSISLNS